MINYLRRSTSDVKGLKPRQPYPVHPLDIKTDTLLGDVAIHPMPPNQRACALRGMAEAFEHSVSGARVD
jgi:hypothetical protein